MDNNGDTLDGKYLGSRTETRLVTLDASGLYQLSEQPKRLAVTVHPAGLAGIKVFPATRSNPGVGGYPLAPGDMPVTIGRRDHGDAARQSMLIVGTAADTVLLTELFDCPCH